MSSVSTISHEERVLRQCFSVNDVIIILKESIEYSAKSKVDLTAASYLAKKNIKSLEVVH